MVESSNNDTIISDSKVGGDCLIREQNTHIDNSMTGSSAIGGEPYDVTIHGPCVSNCGTIGTGSRTIFLQNEMITLFNRANKKFAHATRMMIFWKHAFTMMNNKYSGAVIAPPDMIRVRNMLRNAQLDVDRTYKNLNELYSRYC